MQSKDLHNDGTIDSTVTDSYNANNELLAETDGTSYNTVYAYDANGSPTKVITTRAAATAITNDFYDSRNRMIRVDPTGDTTLNSGGTYGGTTSDDTVYTFDDDGNIVSQKTGTNATNSYLLDTNNLTGYAQRIETWSGGTTLTQSYVIADRIQEQLDGSAPSFFMPDGEGNTRQLAEYSSAGTNGHVTAHYNYTAFGKDVNFVSSHASDSATTLILYKGEPLDLVTGNVVMGVREYVPGLDRFWTQDRYVPAVGDLDNANLFTYVTANPINKTDPTGMFAFTVFGISQMLNWAADYYTMSFNGVSVWTGVTISHSGWHPFASPPPFLLTLVPVLGPTISATYNFANGNYITGTIDAAFAVLDVFGVGEVLSATYYGGKLFAKATSKWVFAGTEAERAVAIQYTKKLMSQFVADGGRFVPSTSTGYFGKYIYSARQALIKLSYGATDGTMLEELIHHWQCMKLAAEGLSPTAIRIHIHVMEKEIEEEAWSIMRSLGFRGK
jgi:RHS repeat-associated protein